MSDERPSPTISAARPSLMRDGFGGGWLPLIVLFILAGVVFCTGITWGLPSRAVDRYLFGEAPAWSGQRIQQLAGKWTGDPTRGADVDRDPLAERDGPVALNETDAQRAEIIQRYRLYTYQPDEMITMRALAEMRPSAGRLDPRLYQYGGLWIYPVGGLLKLVSVAGLVTLKTDVAWYLDHPEAFARFYIVGRAYSAFWGLVGLGAVFWITRRLSDGRVLPAVFAGLCYAIMPVVVNMAHEAKPHLAGAALQLLAVAAAIRYVETGRRTHWLVTAGLCGAAFGMVLSAWPIFILLPLAAGLRPDTWFRKVILVGGGTLVSAAVYFAANPYIVINLFVNQEVLRSNFGNSLAMYAIGRWPEGLVNAAALVAEGASAGVAIVGLLCFIVVAVRAGRMAPGTLKAAILLGAPAMLILVQFVALAAGKPGEYGRFAVLPDVALGIAAVAAIGRILRTPIAQGLLMVMLLVQTAVPGSAYLAGFAADSGAVSSRMRLARLLEVLHYGGAVTLAVDAEPAPYVLPPVDFFAWRISLVPRERDIGPMPVPPDVIVHVLDDSRGEDEPPDGYIPLGDGAGPVRAPTKISWADKRFVVWTRRSLFPTDSSPASDPEGYR